MSNATDRLLIRAVLSFLVQYEFSGRTSQGQAHCPMCNGLRVSHYHTCTLANLIDAVRKEERRLAPAPEKDDDLMEFERYLSTASNKVIALLTNALSTYYGSGDKSRHLSDFEKSEFYARALNEFRAREIIE